MDFRTAKPDTGYSFEVLGVADDFAEADGNQVLSYAQALAAALGRKKADPNRLTVEQALTSWANAKCLEASSDKQRLDIMSSARRISDYFGKKPLKAITGRDISAWINGIVGDADDAKKRRATANRRLSILKAALTRAANENGYEGPRAWEAAKKFPKADSFGKRMVILSPDDEARLIAAARADVAALLTALQMTGARFGEIRLADVTDLHGKRLTLKGKTGQRTITLSDDKAKWFAEQIVGRPADAPLIPRRDGARWPDGGQLKPVQTAVKGAGLPDDVTTYALRHGFISRALSAGVPITAVAQHCGTSPEMIAATYAKFSAAQMQEWFA